VVPLDELDRKAVDAFPGHMVRKDLVRMFRGQFPVCRATRQSDPATT